MNLTFACGSEISENLSTFPPVLLLKPLFVVFPVLLKTYHDSILGLRPTHTWSWYCDTEIVSPSMLQSPKASVPPLRVQDIPIPASCADGVHHVPQIQSYSSLQPCCCVWFRISKSKSCTPPTIQHLKTTAWKRYQKELLNESSWSCQAPAWLASLLALRDHATDMARSQQISKRHILKGRLILSLNLFVL